MFGWFLRKRVKSLEDGTKKGFSGVKKDFESVGKWVKHLDERDKRLFDLTSELKGELSSIREALEELGEYADVSKTNSPNKQVFKKLPVLYKQTAVGGVQDSVQTAVQTGNLYEILNGLSGNERLVVFTLMNNDMKLSYEDLAMLLGKERSTVRGQINAIKQKSEGLIEELIEKNGKKRVFIPQNIKEKLSKYAKVRVGKSKKR